MSFEFDPDGQLIVDWPVTIKLPVNGGKTDDKKVSFKFLLLKEDDIKDLTADKIKEHIKGWSGLKDSRTGEALEFNDENLSALFEHKFINRPVLKALIDASSGAAEKN